MHRSKVSTALEVAGAVAITTGASSLTSAAVGLVVGGAFCLVFGLRMGNT